MDVGALRECIGSTLSANADIRRRAELQLKAVSIAPIFLRHDSERNIPGLIVSFCIAQAEVQKGFVAALTDLVSSEPDPNLRLSGTQFSTCFTECTYSYGSIAVVYLKNKVTRSWEFNEDFPKIPSIAEDEKAILRDRLVPTLASSPSNIRQQLLPLIGKVLHYDFPERWPSYMDITVQLLNSNDIQSVFAGVQCLLSLCRVYRFKRDTDKRDELDRVTQATFPTLLAIGNKLVEETSTDAGDMLKMVIKTYKHAVYVSGQSWEEGFLGVIEIEMGWAGYLIA
jgi:hypothetical protein